MFKIGEFSKLSQVTVKTLRYYDEIGLLKPARIDRFTGYRYYSASQLPRLNRILALKDLGLSLTQIVHLLDGELPPEQIRGMLRRKQVELQQQVEEEQARLARVEARLRQIEKEGKMSDYEVVIKEIAPLKVASIREVIPTYSDVGQLFGELFGFLGQHGLKPAGIPLAIYYDEEYRERDVDIEAAIPVDQPWPESERVTVRQLPAVKQMASVVHQGSYESIGEAYNALMTWIETNGYRICGYLRENYIRGSEPGVDPSSYVTEVQAPVEKA